MAARDRVATYRIQDTRQIECLASPARQEVVDALTALGPCSIAELADDLGRAPDSLYYHVRALTRAGLVVARGTRGAGAREEALFDVPGSQMVIDKEPQTPRERKTLLKLITAFLRIAERDFAAALASGIAVCKRGSRRNATGARIKGWLDREERTAVLEHLDAIADILRRSTRRRGSNLHAVTFVLTPLTPSKRARVSSESSARKGSR